MDGITYKEFPNKTLTQKGNVNNSSPVEIVFNPPVTALSIKIKILSFVGNPCMRLAVYATDADSQPVATVSPFSAMNNSLVKITGQDVEGDYSGPRIALDFDKSLPVGWCGMKATESVTFRFAMKVKVFALKLRGIKNSDQTAWITKFSMAIAHSASNAWNSYWGGKVLDANTDENSVFTHTFDPPLEVYAFRFIPIEFATANCFRADVMIGFL
jgi:hypothetical protein